MKEGNRAAGKSHFNPLEGLAEVVRDYENRIHIQQSHFNPLEGLAEVVSVHVNIQDWLVYYFNPLEGLAEVVSNFSVVCNQGTLPF